MRLCLFCGSRHRDCAGGTRATAISVDVRRERTIQDWGVWMRRQGRAAPANPSKAQEQRGSRQIQCCLFSRAGCPACCSAFSRDCCTACLTSRDALSICDCTDIISGAKNTRILYTYYIIVFRSSLPYFYFDCGIMKIVHPIPKSCMSECEGFSHSSGRRRWRCG